MTRLLGYGWVYIRTRGWRSGFESWHGLEKSGWGVYALVKALQDDIALFFLDFMMAELDAISWTYTLSARYVTHD